MAHKCFISYHKADQDEFEKFVKKFCEDAGSFIYRAVCEMDQNIIDSDDDSYVMRRIREEYLKDSTVTIVLVGKCTWARKYVDWEIASTLRNDTKNKRSGLLGILLPSAKADPPQVPARLGDNLTQDDAGYARYRHYPTDCASLTRWIEDAFNARDSRAHLVDNSRARRKINSACS